MDVELEELEVQHNVEGRRFEVHLGDEIARLEYRMRDSTIIYTHTIVPMNLEGHGIAGRLARHALGYARDAGLSVVPQCPYVADFIEKHPEYADLVVRQG